VVAGVTTGTVGVTSCPQEVMPGPSIAMGSRSSFRLMLNLIEPHDLAVAAAVG
jgi:hypothetical protein